MGETFIYQENYKTWLKNIKEDLNKGRWMPWSWMERFPRTKDVNFPQISL